MILRVQQVLQDPEIGSICVLLRKYHIFFGQSKQELFSLLIKKATGYLQDSSQKEKQMIVDCFGSYPSTLPTFVNMELERLIPFLRDVDVSPILHCLSESCLMLLLPAKIEEVLHELSQRNGVNVWNICKETMTLNVSRLVWCNLMSLLKKQRDQNVEKLIETMIDGLQRCTDIEFCHFIECAITCLNSYPSLLF